MDDLNNNPNRDEILAIVANAFDGDPASVCIGDRFASAELGLDHNYVVWDVRGTQVTLQRSVGLEYVVHQRTLLDLVEDGLLIRI